LSRAKLLTVALLVAAASFGYVLLHDRMQLGTAALSLSPREVEELVGAWGMWGVAGSLLLMVLHSFVPIPAEVIAVANGMMFGSVWGSVVTWCGAMIGALSAFALARWLGRPFVRRVISDERRAGVERWTSGAGALLTLRLIPLVSFNLVNYAAGLAGAGWWTFVWTTAVGILPLTILTAILGARMLDITWPAWAAIGAVVIVLSLALHTWRRSRRVTEPDRVL
jgi:uncharacterized membrane protein YdjX (TVP38/TMEM64 family)